MCGRYASFLPAEALSRIFGTRNAPPNFAPTWNLAPSQLAPVVRRHPETGERHLDLLQWGLMLWWQQSVKRPRSINARAEGVAKAHLYRGAFAQRGCIVPADAFYEWRLMKGRRDPFAIARRDSQPIAFAGLWESFFWPDVAVIRTFAIITTNAGPDVARLHERMPVVLEPADWPAWLGEVEGNPASVLHPSPEGTLRVWPVDRKVSSPRNNGPELIEPVELTA